MADDTQVASGGRPAAEYREVADALRARVDLYGKSLGAIATAGITAVGLGKFGDLFPAGDNTCWAIAACVGIGVAALAVVWIAARLMRVARPVFMESDFGGSELSEDEKAAVQPVYTASAKRFGYVTLKGLELRERSLRRAAGRAQDETERERRTALADEVKLELEQALARGQVVVVRTRAANAVGDGLAAALYVLVVAGLIVFAVGANKVPNERNDPIAKAKACGDARKAGATPTELGRTNGICEAAGAKTPEPAPPSADEARVEVAAALVEVLKTCASLLHEASDPKSGPLTPDDCAPIHAAAIAALAK